MAGVGPQPPIPFKCPHRLSEALIGLTHAALAIFHRLSDFQFVATYRRNEIMRHFF